MRLLDRLFRRTEPRPAFRRNFQAANSSRLIDWALSYANVNQSLRYDYLTMTLRARYLAKNNEYIAGYLNNLSRNVIGPDGFVLQSRASSEEDRNAIEELWREYQSRVGAFVTLDEHQSGRDFDALVLRTLIIDGEVFIRRVYDAESRFGYRYEVIDSLTVDTLYNVTASTPDDDAIIMGIRFDARGREKAYYIRESTTDWYNSGPRIEVPASEIIHIYRKQFADQARGYTAFAPIILNLNQMDAYKEAELIHARIQACAMGVWEYNGQGGGDVLDEVDEKGEFVREIKPGIFPVAPRGYTAKFLQNTSPNNQFGTFWKNMLRSISNALGISYNKAAGDYESVNYSSLREATLEDRASFEELQKYLIENWKDFPFADFIRALVWRDVVPAGRMADSLRHRFFGRRFPWVDPAKEIAAKEKEYDLLLTDPITELESRGQDPEELLDRWERWNAMLEAKGLPFMSRPPVQIEENPQQEETEDDRPQDQ